MPFYSELGCARRPIERQPSSVSRRVGWLHPCMLQKIFFRQNLSGLSYVFGKRRAKPALLDRKHADESRGRRRICGNPALSRHLPAGGSPFSFKSFLAAFNLRRSQRQCMMSRQAKSAAPSPAFLAAPTSACLAASMMSIVFSAPRRNFVWFDGNLQIKQ
jgi:hypothetical protein